MRVSVVLTMDRLWFVISLVAALLGQASSASAQTADAPPELDVAPVVDAAPDRATNEGAVWLGRGSFTDPDSSSWTATVDYGDGSGVQPLALTGFTFALSHLYVQDGRYRVTTCVTDNQGLAGCKPITATIKNSVPVITIDPVAPAATGTPFTISGTFTDAGVEDVHIGYVDWADVSTSDATVTDATPGTGTFRATHTFVTAGDFVAMVCINDGVDDGCTNALIRVTGDSTPPPPPPPACSNSRDDDADGLVDYPADPGCSDAADGDETDVTAPPPDPGVVPHDPADGPRPTVLVSPDRNVDEGQTWTAQGSFSDPTGVSWTATVDYGLGAGPEPLALAGNLFTLARTYPENGNFGVTVCVTDDGGNRNCYTTTARITNRAPVIVSRDDAYAVAGVPRTHLIGFTDVGVDDTHTGAFEWGDGAMTAAGISEVPGSGTAAGTHAYSTTGRFTAGVCIEDDDGGAVCTTAFVVIVVPDLPPTISVPDADIRLGALHAPSIPYAILNGVPAATVVIDWGDGTSTTVEVAGPGGFTLPTHLYASAGTYTVTATITDLAGAVGSAMGTVRVRAPDVPPAVVPLDASGFVGAPIATSFTWSDPDGTGPHTAVIDWGDGSTSPATLHDHTGAASHTFAAPGIYTASVTVTDANGVSTTRAFTITVFVPDVPPVVVPADASGLVGVAIAAPFTWSDPDGTGPYTATIAWGDGTTSAATLGAGTGTASHAFAAAGVYTASVTVTDANGVSTTRTFTITVTALPRGPCGGDGTASVPGHRGDKHDDDQDDHDGTFDRNGRGHGEDDERHDGHHCDDADDDNDGDDDKETEREEYERRKAEERAAKEAREAARREEYERRKAEEQAAKDAEEAARREEYERRKAEEQAAKDAKEAEEAAERAEYERQKAEEKAAKEAQEAADRAEYERQKAEKREQKALEEAAKKAKGSSDKAKK